MPAPSTAPNDDPAVAAFLAEVRLACSQMHAKPFADLAAQARAHPEWRAAHRAPPALPAAQQAMIYNSPLRPVITWLLDAANGRPAEINPDALNQAKSLFEALLAMGFRPDHSRGEAPVPR